MLFYIIIHLLMTFLPPAALLKYTIPAAGGLEHTPGLIQTAVSGQNYKENGGNYKKFC